MWIEIAQWIVLLFGVFFIFIGTIMLIKPKIARAILRKAASTNLINYTEITLRMIPAIGLILAADQAKVPNVFKTIGWFMLLTSILLYLVPRKLHHDFSNKAADILKPFYFQLIAPFSILIGIILIYCIYK
jgi:uncharacterized membrane protein YfcA